MIKITAKTYKNGTGLKVEIEGKAEDIINETMAIVNELPKSLKKANPGAYHEYLRKQLLHGLDHIHDILGSDPDEDEEDENDDESDEV